MHAPVSGCFFHPRASEDSAGNFSRMTGIKIDEQNRRNSPWRNKQCLMRMIRSGERI